MPHDFWLEQYRKKAFSDNPIEQSGRGKAFTPVDFLYVIKQAIELLQLHPTHRLLDIGCGNGLLDIVLSSLCHSISAVEPVEELRTQAVHNWTECHNIQVREGHCHFLDFPENTFDRVLLFEVLQLNRPEELEAVFQNILYVAKPGGRLLIGSIPDRQFRENYLASYIQGVREASHLTSEQKHDIIQRNENAQWYHSNELVLLWRKLGCEAHVHPLSAFNPNHEKRFHLVVNLTKT